MCSQPATDTRQPPFGRTLRGALAAYLELVRAPNLVTAVADVLAGFLYAAGGEHSWNTLPLLCTVSVCLYAGGVTLNDVFDAAQDRTERPARPVPSGRVSRRRAALLAVALLTGGVMLAGLSSGRAAVIASLLVACIVLYDGALKRTPLGPALMGACRALNLLLGISVSLDPTTAAALVPAGLLGWYVASVTSFASREADSPRRTQLLPGACGVVLSVAGLIVLRWTVPDPKSTYLIGVVAVLCVVSVSAWRAIQRLSPQAIQSTVRIFLLMLIGIDGCIAWSARGIDAALLVWALLVPTVLLGRLFRMT